MFIFDIFFALESILLTLLTHQLPIPHNLVEIIKTVWTEIICGVHIPHAFKRKLKFISNMPYCLKQRNSGNHCLDVLIA